MLDLKLLLIICSCFFKYEMIKLSILKQIHLRATAQLIIKQ